jgi:hypothetical protein
MSAGKVVANVLLGLLLFLCLLLVGPGIALQATVMNTGFVERQLKNLDVDAIVREQVLPQIDRIPGFSRYAFLSGSIESALLKHEDEIKARVIEVITDSHRYITRGGAFDLESAVKSKLLDPALGKAILADVDLKEMARELLRQMVPSALSSYNITPYLESAVLPMESWLREKLTALLPGVYDYLFYGGPAPGVINIPVSDIIEVIRMALRQAFIKAPPVEALNIPVSALGTTFDLGWEALKKLLPVAMEIDLTGNLGAPPDLLEPFSDANDSLQRARSLVQGYQNGFWILVAVTLLCVIVIVLVNLNPVSIGFVLGAVFLLSGAISLAAGLLGRGLARSALVNVEGLPASIGPWLTGLVTGVFQPYILFAAVVMVIGFALLVMGFIMRSRRPADLGLRVDMGSTA